mgnify:CR=1 FL=1
MFEWGCVGGGCAVLHELCHTLHTHIDRLCLDPRRFTHAVFNERDKQLYPEDLLVAYHRSDSAGSHSFNGQIKRRPVGVLRCTIQQDTNQVKHIEYPCPKGRCLLPDCLPHVCMPRDKRHLPSIWYLFSMISVSVVLARNSYEPRCRLENRQVWTLS